jgi:hypothetical protein
LKYIKHFILGVTASFFVGCGGDNTTTLLTPDITAIAIDESNIAVYSTDTYTSLHATATYTDGSTQDVSSYLIWSETNSSLVHMSVNTIEIEGNGGDTNVIASYDKFSDSKSLHVHKLTNFQVVYPSDVNVTGTYDFYAVGDFDNNETNRTLVNNVQWSATNDATIEVGNEGIIHITFISGETNVTTTVFNETNTSSPLAPQSKIFIIE